MAARRVSFAVPGRLDSVSGGYGYDRQIIAGLQDLGWAVDAFRLTTAVAAPEVQVGGAARCGRLPAHAAGGSGRAQPHSRRQVRRWRSGRGGPRWRA